MSRKIKVTGIDPKKCHTKSAYSRLLKVSPARVSQMIEEGKLTIVIVNGGELVYAE